MKFNPDIHKRQSIRLKNRDYSKEGAYFVTVCTKNRLCLFGQIIDNVMMLDSAGNMICHWWNELSNKFANVKLDKYVVMPNHFHGIIEIKAAEAIEIRCAYDQNEKGENIQQIQGAHAGAPLRRGRPMCLPSYHGAPLSKMIQWFKSMTTNEYIRNERQNGWPPFDGKLWQRNYYEHIIRGDEPLQEIREYIVNNPINWKDDEMFPEITDAVIAQNYLS